MMDRELLERIYALSKALCIIAAILLGLVVLVRIIIYLIVTAMR